MSNLHHPADRPESPPSAGASVGHPPVKDMPGRFPDDPTEAPWMQEGPIRVDGSHHHLSIAVDDTWSLTIRPRDLGQLVSRVVAIHQASLTIGLNPQDWSSGEARPDTDPHLGRELARLAREVSCDDPLTGDVSTHTDQSGAVKVLTRDQVVCCVEIDSDWAEGRSGAEISAAISAALARIAAGADRP